MEKTNRCSIQFICHGNKMTCKYAKPYDKEYSVVSDVLRKFCIHYYNGHCTCKQAQEEAKSE